MKCGVQDTIKNDQVDLERRKKLALTGVAQLVGCQPTEQKVAGSIPGQRHTPVLWVQSLNGCMREATDRCFSLTSMFLSVFFSLPSPLSKSK